MTEYLALDDLMALADRGGFTVGDYGLLESALARPQATAFGHDAYPTFHEKAAALFQSLAVNHALLDGNKRLSLAALELFYELNDHRITATDDELFDLVIAVATRNLDTVQKIAATLASFVDEKRER